MCMRQARETSRRSFAITEKLTSIPRDFTINFFSSSPPFLRSISPCVAFTSCRHISSLNTINGHALARGKTSRASPGMPRQFGDNYRSLCMWITPSTPEQFRPRWTNGWPRLVLRLHRYVRTRVACMRRVDVVCVCVCVSGRVRARAPVCLRTFTVNTTRCNNIPRCRRTGARDPRWDATSTSHKLIEGVKRGLLFARALYFATGRIINAGARVFGDD